MLLVMNSKTCNMFNIMHCVARSYRFGLIDESQHSRPDNIIDDVLFINT